MPGAFVAAPAAFCAAPAAGRAAPAAGLSIPAAGLSIPAASLSIPAADPASDSPTADLLIAGTGAGLGTLQRLADAFGRHDPALRIRVVPGLGTGGGIKALLAARVSIAVASRALDAGEQARGGRSEEIARTPFVFATRTETMVEGVTLDDLAALYAGRRVAWPDGTPVRPILRPPTDGDTDLVSAMSPALAAALRAAHAREGRSIGITDTDAADLLERIPGSIGTSTLALIVSEQRRLKTLPVAGVQPGLSEMAIGRYPHRKSLFLAWRADAPPALQAFLHFVRSAEGAAVLRSSGCLPAGRGAIA